jgi:hypothetical protein
MLIPRPFFYGRASHSEGAKCDKLAELWYNTRREQL